MPKNYGVGLFLPSYRVKIYRYDCQNDRYSMNTPLSITDAFNSGMWFVYPIGPNENDWRVIPGQTKVMLESRPYWAMRPKSDPRYEEKPVQWKYIVPESNGAAEIDYACINF